MNCFKQRVLQVLFLVAFVGIFAILQHNENQWDFFVFAQQWPEAACIDINESSHETCIMNADIQTWTVHGLWPSRQDGMGPFYCNDSCPFRRSEIRYLEEELDRRWPNLIRGTPKDDFWKHEWNKHGTCGMSLLAIDTESKYFAQGLRLNKRLDFLRVLQKKNITPSTDLYKLDDFRAALESSTQSDIKILCIFAKDRSRQAVVQVEVCFSKEFIPIDCLRSFDFNKNYIPRWDDIPYNPSFETCSEDLPVQYLRLKHED